MNNDILFELIAAENDKDFNAFCKECPWYVKDFILDEERCDCDEQIRVRCHNVWKNGHVETKEIRYPVKEYIYKDVVHEISVTTDEDLHKLVLLSNILSSQEEMLSKDTTVVLPDISLNIDLSNFVNINKDKPERKAATSSDLSVLEQEVNKISKYTLENITAPELAKILLLTLTYTNQGSK